MNTTPAGTSIASSSSTPSAALASTAELARREIALRAAARVDRRVRQAAFAATVGLTVAMSGVYVYADAADHVAAENRAAAGAVVLASLLQDAPANPAEALAAAGKQLEAKQYEEALASLQSIKPDALDDAQKAAYADMLAKVEPAAAGRKNARVAFEEGQTALAAGDVSTAITSFVAARDNAYADEGTAAKAREQLVVAADPAKLQPVFDSALADKAAGNADAARAKLSALAAVNFADASGKTAAAELASIEAPAAAPAATPANADQATAKKAYGLALSQYRKGDWISARSNFQRAVELGYKPGLFETSPADYLAKMTAKEQRDAENTAKALAAAPAVAAGPAAPADVAPPVASDAPAVTPEAAPVVNLQPADAGTAAPAAPAPAVEPAPAPTADATPAPAPTTTEPSAAPAAPATTELQGALAAQKLKAEQDKYRAQQLVTSAAAAASTGRTEEALSQYDLARQLDPSNLEARAGYDDLVARTGRTAASGIETDFERRVRAERQSIQWNFDTNITQARQALTDSRFDDARDAIARARNARNSNTNIFTADEIRSFDSAIAQWERDIGTAAAAKAESDRAAANALATKTAAERAAAEAAERRRTVAALVKQSKELAAQRKYTEAIGVVDQILAIDPTNDYAVGVKPYLVDSKLLRDQRNSKERIDRATTELLNYAEESRIPIPDLLAYPQDWPDIVATREDTLARERGASGDADTDALLAKKLPELRFDQVGFEDAINFLRDLTQANIFVNWPAIEAAGIEKSALINLRLRDVRFDKVLRLLLDNASGGVTQLGYTVDDGVIQISTQEDLARNVLTRTYDIRDLIVSIPDFTDTPDFNLDNQGGGGGRSGGGGGGGGGGGNLFGGGGGGGGQNGGNDGPTRDELVQQIIQIIQNTIASDSWKDNGGLIGSIQELGGQLIVTQTPENHGQLAKLLEQLRETRAIQINVEARFIAVQRNFLEQIGVDFDFAFNFNSENANDNTGLNFPDPNRTFDPVLVTNRTRQFAQPGTLSTGVAGNLASELQAAGENSGTNTQINAYLDNFRAQLVLQASQAGQSALTLTAPRVTLFNGQSAYVLVSTQQAYVSDLEPVVGSGAVGFDPTVDTVNSGVILSVQATVSADRKYVTLTLQPSLSRLVAIQQFATFAGGTVGGGGDGGGTDQLFAGVIQQPILEVTQVRTTVSVPDRGTILLGGQTLSGEITREQGTPVLSKIPIVKRLFTSTGTAKDEAVLLILVKPTIIIQREVELKSFPLLDTAAQ